MLDEKRKNTIISLCKDMIAQPSISGNEKNVAHVLEMFMKENGFDSVYIDEYGSIIGCIK